MAQAVKWRALTFLGLALLITFLIGVGLPRLQFESGLPVPSLDHGDVVAPATLNAPATGVHVSRFLTTLFLIGLAACVALLIYRLARGIPWKTLLPDLARLLVALLILIFVLFLALSFLSKSTVTYEVAALPAPRPLATAPLGPVPAALLWLVGVGLLIAVILVGFSIVRSRRRAAAEPWQLSAEEAREALLAGADLRDVILRCYERMSRALQEEQKIERQASMTTGEFERLLTAKGVPSQPVNQLTRLFDAVRYGHWQPNAGAEQSALECLDAILEHSRMMQKER